MATHVEDQDQQALLPNEQIHDPAPSGYVLRFLLRLPTDRSNATPQAHVEQRRSCREPRSSRAYGGLGGCRTRTSPLPPSSATNGSQQQDDGTPPPPSGVRMSDSEPGFNLLFPHLEWARPGASSLQAASPSASAGSNPIPVRRQRIPYVRPVDSVPGNAGDDLGFSSAFGMEDMPGILMYAPERPLLSPAAGSTDAIPDRMVLCVEEDAFERAWIAPQWYWRSAF